MLVDSIGLILIFLLVPVGIAYIAMRSWKQAGLREREEEAERRAAAEQKEAAEKQDKG